MSTQNRGELVSLLDTFLATYRKQADEAGETSHPVGTADDGTVASSEGAFGKEKSQDVKDQVPAESVNDSGDLIGNTDPKGENVPKYDAEEKPSLSTKREKDDPGTEHPSGAPEKQASIGDLAKDVLSQIAVLGVMKSAQASKKAEEACAGECAATPPPVMEDASKEKKDKPEAEREPTKEEKAAAAAGYNLGNQIADELAGAEYMKVAQAVMAKAAQDAQVYADFIKGFQLGEMAKAAGVEPDMLAQLMAEQGSAAPQGDSADEGAPEEGAPEGSEDEAPAEEAAPEAGPEAGGVVSPEAMGAAGEGGDDAAVQELASALAAQGITPEQLAELAVQSLEGNGVDVSGAAKQAAAKQENIAKIAEVLKAVKTIAGAKLPRKTAKT